MASRRHSLAIARIAADARRLTKRERALLGLPPGPVRRAAEPPPFPSDPGRYVWFALTTLPQREAETVIGLARAGFVAFNPTERVTVRSSRKVKFKRRERQRAMLTSMVLVGVPGRAAKRRIKEQSVPDGHGGTRIVPARTIDTIVADVPWLRIREVEGVTGVVGMGLDPTPVPVANVLRLHALTGQRGATRNWTPAVGDAVEVAVGAFQGQAGEVVALVDGRAQVALFGITGVLAKLVKPLDVPETWVRQQETA